MNTPAFIGRYAVEGPLAQGGMASVYLGKIEGPAGFSKRVVLKRIRPEFADNPSFVDMFLAEAKLAALLSHPNIIHVYDFGRDGTHYFMAMEFVDGLSLRALSNYSQRLGRRLSPRVVAFAMSQVCAGLSYAHNLRDETGGLLSLIHRDVSPDNVLVGREGVAKLADFGIAKVASVSHQTTAGMLKGKLAYMPPEQVLGKELDARVDVYMAGVTLYELLAGQRPYKAANELELAMAITQKDPTPLASLRPQVDPELLRIVDKALAKEREQRYPTAKAFKDELDDWLGTQLKEAEAELCALVEGGVSERPPLPPLTPLTPAAAAKQPVTDPASVDVPLDAISARTHSRARRQAFLLGASLTVCAIAGTALGLRMKSTPAAPAPIAEAARPVAPPPPTPEPAPGPIAPPPEASADAGSAPPPTDTAPAPGPTEATAATPRPTRRADGFLTLRSKPWCDVTIDGAPAGQTPLVKHKLSAGAHALELVNEKAGLKQRLSVAIPPGQTVVRTVAPPMGDLEVEAPAGTKVFRGSELLGVAPMQPFALVAGRHTVGFVNPATGQKGTRDVMVRAGGKARLSLP